MKKIVFTFLVGSIFAGTTSQAQVIETGFDMDPYTKIVGAEAQKVIDVIHKKRGELGDKQKPTRRSIYETTATIRCFDASQRKGEEAECDIYLDGKTVSVRP